MSAPIEHCRISLDVGSAAPKYILNYILEKVREQHPTPIELLMTNKWQAASQCQGENNWTPRPDPKDYRNMYGLLLHLRQIGYLRVVYSMDDSCPARLEVPSNFPKTYFAGTSKSITSTIDETLMIKNPDKASNLRVIDNKSLRHEYRGYWIQTCGPRINRRTGYIDFPPQQGAPAIGRLEWYKQRLRILATHVVNSHFAFKERKRIKDDQLLANLIYDALHPRDRWIMTTSRTDPGTSTLRQLAKLVADDLSPELYQASLAALKDGVLTSCQMNGPCSMPAAVTSDPQRARKRKLTPCSSEECKRSKMFTTQTGFSYPSHQRQPDQPSHPQGQVRNTGNNSKKTPSSRKRRRRGNKNKSRCFNNRNYKSRSQETNTRDSIKAIPLEHCDDMRHRHTYRTTLNATVKHEGGIACIVMNETPPSLDNSSLGDPVSSGAAAVQLKETQKSFSSSFKPKNGEFSARLEQQGRPWLLDTGSQHHYSMSKEGGTFRPIKDFTMNLQTIDGATEVNDVWTGSFHPEEGKIPVNNVFSADEMRFNLLSVGQLADQTGLCFIFTDKNVITVPKNVIDLFRQHLPDDDFATVADRNAHTKFMYAARDTAFAFGMPSRVNKRDFAKKGGTTTAEPGIYGDCKINHQAVEPLRKLRVQTPSDSNGSGSDTQGTSDHYGSAAAAAAASPPQQRIAFDPATPMMSPPNVDMCLSSWGRMMTNETNSSHVSPNKGYKYHLLNELRNKHDQGYSSAAMKIFADSTIQTISSLEANGSIKKIDPDDIQRMIEAGIVDRKAGVTELRVFHMLHDWDEVHDKPTSSDDCHLGIYSKIVAIDRCPDTSHRDLAFLKTQLSLAANSMVLQIFEVYGNSHRTEIQEGVLIADVDYQGVQFGPYLIRQKLLGFRGANDRIKEELMGPTLNFRSTINDPALFVKHEPSGSTIVRLWGDNMIITASSATLIDKLRKDFPYPIRRTSTIDHQNRIKIIQEGEKGSITISQEDYIHDLALLYGVIDLPFCTNKIMQWVEDKNCYKAYPMTKRSEYNKRGMTREEARNAVHLIANVIHISRPDLKAELATLSRKLRTTRTPASARGAAVRMLISELYTSRKRQLKLRGRSSGHPVRSLIFGNEMMNMEGFKIFTLGVKSQWRRNKGMAGYVITHNGDLIISMTRTVSGGYDTDVQEAKMMRFALQSCKPLLRSKQDITKKVAPEPIVCPSEALYRKATKGALLLPVGLMTRRISDASNLASLVVSTSSATKLTQQRLKQCLKEYRTMLKDHSISQFFKDYGCCRWPKTQKTKLGTAPSQAPIAGVEEVTATPLNNTNAS